MTSRLRYADVFLLSLYILTQGGCGLGDYTRDPSGTERGWRSMGEDLDRKSEKARGLCQKYIGASVQQIQDEWGRPHDSSKTIRSVRKNDVWLQGKIGGWWQPIPIDEMWAYRRLRSKELKWFPPEYDVKFYFKDGVVVWVETQ